MFFLNNHYFEYHPPKYGHGKKNKNQKHSCVLKLTVSTCALKTSSSHLETLALDFLSFLLGPPPPDRCRFSKSRQCAGLLHRYGWGRCFTGRVTSPPKKMHQPYNMATRFLFMDLLRLHGKNHPHLPEPLSTCLAITIPQIFRHLTPGAAATRTARPERLVVAPKLFFFRLETRHFQRKIVISSNFF